MFPDFTKMQQQAEAAMKRAEERHTEQMQVALLQLRISTGKTLTEEQTATVDRLAATHFKK